MEIYISVIKYTTLFFCCFYAFTKLTCTKPKFIDLIFIPYSIGASVALFYFPEEIKVLIPISIFILFTAYALIRYRFKFADTFCLSVISMGAVAFIMVASFLVSLVLLLAFYLIPDIALRNLVRQCVLTVIQILAVVLFFKIKRFKNGIANLKYDGTYERPIFTGIINIIALTCFYTKEIENSIILQLYFFLVALGSVSFLIWWRKLISSDYREHVKKRNIEVLTKNLKSAEEERDNLKRQNEELSKIIHRDNKLLPALEIAVANLREKYPEEVLAFDREIRQLLEERTVAVDGMCGAEELPKTGFLLIDAAIEFLQSAAEKQNVDFAFETEENAVSALIEVFAEPADLNTVLCDLGENARIAAGGSSDGKVKIKLFTEGGIPCLAVYDNGAPFDVGVLKDMGRRRHTTHKDDGGSGIGLITVFEICGKYSASLVIDETADGEFTKRVIVCADGKGEHRIRTPRVDAQKACQTRSDLIVLK